MQWLLILTAETLFVRRRFILPLTRFSVSEIYRAFLKSYLRFDNYSSTHFILENIFTLVCTIPPTMAQTTSFLSLPTEIRFQIYGIAFSCLQFGSVIELPAGRCPIDLNMLRTCRYIHDELLNFLFSGKRICTRDDYLSKMIDTINPTVFHIIACLHCDLTGGLMQLEPLWRSRKNGSISLKRLVLNMRINNENTIRNWWNLVLDLSLLSGEENFEKMRSTFTVHVRHHDDHQDTNHDTIETEKDWRDAIVRKKKLNITLPISLVDIHLMTTCSYLTFGIYVLQLLLLKPYKNRLMKLTHIRRSDTVQWVGFDWVEVQKMV